MIAAHRFRVTGFVRRGLLATSLLGIGCSTVPPPSAPSPSTEVAPTEVAPTIQLRPLGSLPHDPAASTQGLYYQDGFLVESTGGYGSSTLRRIPLEAPGMEVRLDVPGVYFAEGIAQFQDRIYQLTWRKGTALVYDKETLRQIDTFRYRGEGWGLTSDGFSLIMSDGTDRLRFLNPETFENRATVRVRDGPHPVRNLNELEWVEGEIWANIWFRNKIAVIDPATGIVLRWLDLTPFLPAGDNVNSAGVPNGIAYDVETRRVFLTGKLWPHIQIVELPDDSWP